jgi:hypothetical protein
MAVDFTDEASSVVDSPVVALKDAGLRVVATKVAAQCRTIAADRTVEAMSLLAAAMVHTVADRAVADRMEAVDRAVGAGK